VVHAGALGAALKTISGLGNRTDVVLNASGPDGGEVDGVSAWLINAGGGDGYTPNPVIFVFFNTLKPRVE